MLEFKNRSEKVASALYWITGFFSDQEPLKWEVRALASELISLAVSLRENFFKDRDLVLYEARTNILKITGLCTVAKNANIVSPENFNLLNEELNKCLAILDYPLNISDLLNAQPIKDKMKELEGGILKDKTEGLQEKTPLKDFGAVSVKKNNRQSIIINLLKRKKEIIIKDISSLIEGCSEKTIQRELSAMVSSGLVKRVGNKRWSRYSLA